SLMARLSKQPHVVANAPAIYEQVLISRAPRARCAVLKGIGPGDERKVSDLLNTVRNGSADALEDTKERVVPLTDTARSPSALAEVEGRVSAMPPIILG